MITTKTATGEALLGLLTPPFDAQRLEISAAIADINVAANASAKTAGVKRDFRCCWSDSALQRKLTTRGSSANFCIQTADLSAFGRPGHWRKVAGCLPGRCGGVAAAFCCSPCWPATSRLGEDQAVLRTGQVDSERPVSRPLALCSRSATYPARLRRPGRFCWLF